ncbi:MAG: type II toxin-antitoxin system PemK/MazF family toxin [Bacteroidetes bacterium]|nr:type II toxin-antitoxin system PemK/MazF family toxin [Bacteroidota bacterium]
MDIAQYQVAIVNLDPTIGSEIKKTRPCVVVSPDEMNRHLKTVVIAPVTSTSKPYPTRVKINLQNNESWVVIDQIRTIDKARITKVVATLQPDEILEVKDVIKQTFVD